MAPEINTPELRKAAFNHINLLWTGDEDALTFFSSKLPSQARSVIDKLYKVLSPVHDDKDLPEDCLENRAPGQKPDSGKFDQEQFPRDLPNDLIAELIDPDKIGGT